MFSIIIRAAVVMTAVFFPVFAEAQKYYERRDGALSPAFVSNYEGFCGQYEAAYKASHDAYNAPKVFKRNYCQENTYEGKIIFSGLYEDPGSGAPGENINYFIATVHEATCGAGYYLDFGDGSQQPVCKSSGCDAKAGQEVTLNVVCGTVSNVKAVPGSNPVRYLGDVVETGPPNSAVKGGCELAFSSQPEPPVYGIKTMDGLKGSGGLYCAADYIYTGQNGTGNDTETMADSDGDGLTDFPPNVTPMPPGEPCPSGTTAGQVQGVDVCVKNSTTEPGTGTGTGTTPGTGTGSGDDGSGSGQEQPPTTGTCVPTPTTPCPSTGTGSGSTNGTYSGTGDCGTAPQCSGDVLQCGIIMQEWRNSCRETAITDGDKQTAQGLVDDAEGDYQDIQGEANSDADGFFSDFQSKLNSNSNARCPTDIRVAIMDGEIDIPFSKACDFFKLLRVAVLAVAYLAAARIVFAAM